MYITKEVSYTLTSKSWIDTIYTEFFTHSIAATIFIYFLNYYNILYRDGRMVIDNNTLTSLTILIAESNPKEKEVLVDLVMNFLSDD